MVESIKILGVFAISILVGFGLFVGLFRLEAFRSVDIVFYRGLCLLVISGALTLTALILARSFLGISISTAISAAVLSMSLNLSFLIVFPVTINRSMTVFLLSEMDQHPDQVFTSDEMKGIFIARYLGEWNQIARRMKEQLLSGNVEQSGTGYKISRQGRAFMRLSRTLASIFKTDPRFVGGTEARSESRHGAEDRVRGAEDHVVVRLIGQKKSTPAAPLGLLHHGQPRPPSTP